MFNNNYRIEGNNQFNQIAIDMASFVLDIKVDSEGNPANEEAKGALAFNYLYVTQALKVIGNLLEESRVGCLKDKVISRDDLLKDVQTKADLLIKKFEQSFPGDASKYFPREGKEFDEQKKLFQEKVTLFRSME